MPKRPCEAVALCLAGGMLAGEPAAGEIHDYMIRRLVYLGTPCGLEHLQEVVADRGHRRFRVTCRNVSAYPNGLTVHCTDIDDDRSCVVEESPREFKSLELLRNPEDIR